MLDLSSIIYHPYCIRVFSYRGGMLLDGKVVANQCFCSHCCCFHSSPLHSCNCTRVALDWENVSTLNGNSLVKFRGVDAVVN
jgi:hypothetical protein